MHGVSFQCFQFVSLGINLEPVSCHDLGWKIAHPGGVLAAVVLKGHPSIPSQRQVDSNQSIASVKRSYEGWFSTALRKATDQVRGTCYTEVWVQMDMGAARHTRQRWKVCVLTCLDVFVVHTEDTSESGKRAEAKNIYKDALGMISMNDINSLRQRHSWWAWATWFGNLRVIWVKSPWVKSLWVKSVWVKSVWVKSLWVKSLWVKNVWVKSLWVKSPWVKSLWVKSVWVKSVWVKSLWVKSLWVKNVWVKSLWVKVCGWKVY